MKFLHLCPSVCYTVVCNRRKYCKPILYKIVVEARDDTFNDRWQSMSGKEGNWVRNDCFTQFPFCCFAYFLLAVIIMDDAVTIGSHASSRAGPIERQCRLSIRRTPFKRSSTRPVT